MASTDGATTGLGMGGYSIPIFSTPVSVVDFINDVVIENTEILVEIDLHTGVMTETLRLSADGNFVGIIEE